MPSSPYESGWTRRAFLGATAAALVAPRRASAEQTPMQREIGQSFVDGATAVVRAQGTALPYVTAPEAFDPTTNAIIDLVERSGEIRKQVPERAPSSAAPLSEQWLKDTHAGVEAGNVAFYDAFRPYFPALPAYSPDAYRTLITETLPKYLAARGVLAEPQIMVLGDVESGQLLALLFFLTTQPIDRVETVMDPIRGVPVRVLHLRFTDEQRRRASAETLTSSTPMSSVMGGAVIVHDARIEQLSQLIASGRESYLGWTQKDDAPGPMLSTPDEVLERVLAAQQDRRDMIAEAEAVATPSAQRSTLPRAAMILIMQRLRDATPAQIAALSITGELERIRTLQEGTLWKQTAPLVTSTMKQYSARRKNFECHLEIASLLGMLRDGRSTDLALIHLLSMYPPVMDATAVPQGEPYALVTRLLAADVLQRSPESLSLEDEERGLFALAQEPPERIRARAKALLETRPAHYHELLVSPEFSYTELGTIPREAPVDAPAQWPIDGKRVATTAAIATAIYGALTLLNRFTTRVHQVRCELVAASLLRKTGDAGLDVEAIVENLQLRVPKQLVNLQRRQAALQHLQKLGRKHPRVLALIDALYRHLDEKSKSQLERT